MRRWTKSHFSRRAGPSASPGGGAIGSSAGRSVRAEWGRVGALVAGFHKVLVVRAGSPPEGFGPRFLAFAQRPRRTVKLREDQRRRFMQVAQEMQEKIEPLMRQAQSGGSPQEIGPKIRKIRKEQERRIGAILNDGQAKQWKVLLGEPLDLGD